MHAMYQGERKADYYQGKTILHNVPLTITTLMKIACLTKMGAKVTVTNPSFMYEDQQAIKILAQENIAYLPLSQVSGRYDFLLDCGAELIENCKANHGIVELTRTGAIRYQELQQKQSQPVPIISVDDSRLKCLETCLGTGEGVYRAITQLAGVDLRHCNLLLFGFGKVGVGIAYYFSTITPNISVVEPNTEKHHEIEKRNFKAIDGKLTDAVEQAAKAADVIITATGIKDLISNLYSQTPFTGKILANAGAEDEFGYQFTDSQVLAEKKPVNFALKEPTLMQFLDPIFYAHNIALEEAIDHPIAGYRSLQTTIDRNIVKRWAKLHGWSLEKLDSIF